MMPKVLHPSQRRGRAGGHAIPSAVSDENFFLCVQNYFTVSLSINGRVVCHTGFWISPVPVPDPLPGILLSKARFNYIAEVLNEDDQRMMSYL
jgi:hypothetical protein